MPIPASYDPDKVPDIPVRMLAIAEEYRLHPVYVLCDEPDAKVGDHVGVAFWTLCHFLPRVGDVIELQDGGCHRVMFIQFKVGTIPETDGDLLAPLMTPTVRTLRLGQGDTDSRQ